MKCKRCGSEYNCRPAISRIDGSEICPLCGNIEAVEASDMNCEDKKLVINVLNREYSKTSE